MPFTQSEIDHLKTAKYVGDKVIGRLLEMGIDSVLKLKKSEEAAILEMGSRLSGSSCWKNSPQAKQAVKNLLKLAREMP